MILHCSPSGAIERIIYALLEKAYLAEKAGKPPMIPVWLCPTQVRIIPVSNKHFKKAMLLSKELEKENIRVDVDDTNETVNKRIRNSEEEWIPYIIVLGDKEMKSTKIR